jgi:hypothetical protein
MAPPLPAWVAYLPDLEGAAATHGRLEGEWGALEAAVEAMAGRSQQAGETAQREALLRVHQRLSELGGAGTPYGAAFEAYMLHAGARCARGGGSRAAARGQERCPGCCSVQACAAVLPDCCHGLPLHRRRLARCRHTSPPSASPNASPSASPNASPINHRLEEERGPDAAAAAVLAAAVFAINAQQEAGAPPALRAMLAPAASLAAAVVAHASTQKPPARLALSGA